MLVLCHIHRTHEIRLRDHLHGYALLVTSPLWWNATRSLLVETVRLAQFLEAFAANLGYANLTCYLAWLAACSGWLLGTRGLAAG